MVVVINERRFTVKEIIDHSVNCLGGTHHGEPKNEQIALKELETLYFGLDTNSIIRQTKSIGYVVLDAMKELKEKVIKKYYS